MYKVELNEYGYLIVSDGTCNPEYLIPTFISFLSDYVEDREEKKELEELRSEFERYAAMEYYEGEESMAEMCDFLYDMMNSLAPDGAYFGGAEGDPACIGFWTDEEF